MIFQYWLTSFLLFTACAILPLQMLQASEPTESFEKTKSKAEKGDAEAQYFLGCYYSPPFLSS